MQDYYFDDKKSFVSLVAHGQSMLASFRLLAGKCQPNELWADVNLLQGLARLFCFVTDLILDRENLAVKALPYCA